MAVLGASVPKTSAVFVIRGEWRKIDRGGAIGSSESGSDSGYDVVNADHVAAQCRLGSYSVRGSGIQMCQR